MTVQLTLEDLLDKSVLQDKLSRLYTEFDELLVKAVKKMDKRNADPVPISNVHEARLVLAAVTDEVDRVRVLLDRAQAFMHAVWKHMDQLKYAEEEAAVSRAKELLHRFNTTHWEPLRKYVAAA